MIIKIHKRSLSGLKYYFTGPEIQMSKEQIINHIQSQEIPRN